MADDRSIDAYDPSSFEAGHAARWVDEGLFEAEDPRTSPKPKFYCLDMFPYPSGDLHMGHLEAFTGGDVVARYKWLRGYNVLHPIGWDAFGLPAENAAIKSGVNPRAWTYPNIEEQASSFKRLGMSFDWSRRFNTCDPEYYRWTQWLFLKFYEAGTVYRKAAPTNWCPSCKTVLANEQVVAGLCERCDTPVTTREFNSWFFRESDYAQRLLDDMDQLTGWSEHALTMQRNWIGRSEGADVTFTVEETGDEVTVFTTRPDTLWGATFFVLAPEHPLAAKLVRGKPRQAMFEEFLGAVGRRNDIERTAIGKRKEAFFTGAHAINPANGERIPIWCSDYVLMDYGTGAIMAVPAHDQRDFEFASQEGIPIRVVIEQDGVDPSVTPTEPYPGEGTLVNSGDFDGTSTPDGIPKVIDWLEEIGVGVRKIRYRLRDWNVSRQRFWGCPIPMVHCPKDGPVPVPADQLPVELPELDDYKPSATGESPLARRDDWVNTTCPACGGDAKRDTDTLDTFIDSSWYLFRYCGLAEDAAIDRDAVAAWMPADHYTGGITHIAGHLLYTRYFTKVMHDIGLVDFTEPFPTLLNQGMVIMEGSAMSKSRGNLVQPSGIVDRYGADAARVTMMFAGPFETDVDWADVSPQGTFRWLSRIWRLTLENKGRFASVAATGESDLRRATHRTIAAVTVDMERNRFNTAISKQMTLTNELGDTSASVDADVAEAIEALLIMLAPFAPFITEELWQRLGRDGSIHMATWPSADASLVAEDTVTMVVQVNGKVRDRIEVATDIDEAGMLEHAAASENVQKFLTGKDIVKTIVVPPKLVNYVVK